MLILCICRKTYYKTKHIIQDKKSFCAILASNYVTLYDAGKNIYASFVLCNWKFLLKHLITAWCFTKWKSRVLALLWKRQELSSLIEKNSKSLKSVVRKFWLPKNTYILPIRPKELWFFESVYMITSNSGFVENNS